MEDEWTMTTTAFWPFLKAGQHNKSKRFKTSLQ